MYTLAPKISIHGVTAGPVSCVRGHWIPAPAFCQEGGLSNLNYPKDVIFENLLWKGEKTKKRTLSNAG